MPSVFLSFLLSLFLLGLEDDMEGCLLRINNIDYCDFDVRALSAHGLGRVGGYRMGRT